MIFSDDSVNGDPNHPMECLRDVNVSVLGGGDVKQCELADLSSDKFHFFLYISLFVK